MPKLSQTFKQQKRESVAYLRDRIKGKGLDTQGLLAATTRRPNLRYIAPEGVPAKLLAEFHETYKHAMADCEGSEYPLGAKTWTHILAVYSAATGEFVCASPFFRLQDAQAAAVDAIEDIARDLAFQRGKCCGWRVESDMDLKCIIVKHEVLRGSFFFDCACSRLSELREQVALLRYFAEHATGRSGDQSATGPTLDDATSIEDTEAPTAETGA